MPMETALCQDRGTLRHFPLGLNSVWRLSSASAPHAVEAPTAAERVLAAELQARGNETDALSMMVASMARMVQCGKASDSRWKAN